METWVIDILILTLSIAQCNVHYCLEIFKRMQFELLLNYSN